MEENEAEADHNKSLHIQRGSFTMKGNQRMQSQNKGKKVHKAKKKKPKMRKVIKKKISKRKRRKRRRWRKNILRMFKSNNVKPEHGDEYDDEYNDEYDDEDNYHHEEGNAISNNEALENIDNKKPLLQFEHINFIDEHNVVINGKVE